MKKKSNVNKKKSNVRFEFETALLWLGGFANITMWVGAFSSTEVDGPVGDWIRIYLLPVLGSLSGLAMGITAVAGLVLVLVRFSQMQPTYERKVRGKDEMKTYVNYRYWLTLAVSIVLLIIPSLLLSPVAFAQLSGAKDIYSVMGDRWARFWAVGRIVAADLVLGGIALVQGVHPGANRSAGEPGASGSLSGKSESARGGSAKGSGRSAKVSAKKAAAGAVYACPHAGAGCEVTKPTQEAINAHSGRCKFKPIAVMPSDAPAQKVER